MLYRKLRTIRKQRGLTQAQVADLLGCSRVCYFNWEHGYPPQRVYHPIIERFLGFRVEFPKRGMPQIMPKRRPKRRKSA